MLYKMNMWMRRIGSVLLVGLYLDDTEPNLSTHVELGTGRTPTHS